MSDFNIKQVFMPLFLLVLMVLSVVGLSYSPTAQRGQTPSGSPTQQSFTYNGYDFSYTSQGGQQVLSTTVNGRDLAFSSRPSSVERYTVPASFQSMLLNTSSLTVIAPSGPTNQQAQYVANQVASDVQQRTGLTATSMTMDTPSCDGSPRLIIRRNATTDLVSETGQNCYTTSTLDQGIFILTDYIAYTYHGII